jgi:putative peptidoglycan lipid II flippase
VGMNVVLGLILMWPLGHVGLALATTFASWFQTIWLGKILMQKGWFSPSRDMIIRIGGMLFASIAMAITIQFATPFVLEYSGLIRLSAAVGLCVAGAFIYLMLAHVIGVARIDVAIAEFRGREVKS